MKFKAGQLYKLKYSVHKNSRKYEGLYEFIGNRGSKLHFFDNESGVDLLTTKEEVKTMIQEK